MLITHLLYTTKHPASPSRQKLWWNIFGGFDLRLRRWSSAAGHLCHQRGTKKKNVRKFLKGLDGPEPWLIARRSSGKCHPSPPCLRSPPVHFSERALIGNSEEGEKVYRLLQDAVRNACSASGAPLFLLRFQQGLVPSQWKIKSHSNLRRVFFFQWLNVVIYFSKAFPSFLYAASFSCALKHWFFFLPFCFPQWFLLLLFVNQ